ncbi:hypothetical protein ACFW2I_36130 [Streptomyces nigra]|uniref:hypothetical protein n=1 Tax=Streptomyces nigra TaxID=1827580 RepID=UPI0036BD9CB2
MTRDITQALPPAFADQSFTTQEQGATEQQLQQIAADSLAQMYFRASRAEGLVVELTDVEPLGSELRVGPSCLPAATGADSSRGLRARLCES